MENRSQRTRTKTEHDRFYNGLNLALINGRHVAKKFRQAQASQARTTSGTRLLPEPELSLLSSKDTHPKLEPGSSSSLQLDRLEDTTPLQQKSWDLARTRKVGRASDQLRDRLSYNTEKSICLDPGLGNRDACELSMHDCVRVLVFCLQ